MIGIGFAVPVANCWPWFLWAKICFSVAAMIFLVKVANIAIVMNHPFWERALFVFVLFGITGLLTTEVIRGIGGIQPFITAPLQPVALSFKAFWVGIGNLPERSKVTNTWDGKPWDEHDYADVRLTITNGLDLALQNVDLDINVATEEPTGIAGIGQLTNINGIEFRKPALNIREPTLQLQDKSDGKWYNLPLSPFFDEHRIVPDYRIFCPRLAQRDIIRLILATIHLEQHGKPPKKLRITGSYVTESGQGRTTGQVNEVVIVAQ